MRNVIVYDRATNKELWEAEYLPDNEAEIKPILLDQIGYGSFRLRWKDRKRKDGKYVEFPRQMLVRCLEPMTPGKQKATERAGSSVPSVDLSAVPQADSLVVRLILERMDAGFKEIGNRIDTVMDFMQEEDPEELGGLPAEVTETPPPGDFSGILQSIAKDPAYSGLVGSIMLNATTPENIWPAVQEQMNKDPNLMAGLMSKFLPILLQGAM